MAIPRKNIDSRELPRFDRGTLDSRVIISCLGNGNIGGKASGLARIQKALTSHFEMEPFSGFQISIPRMVVVASDIFDNFMQRNSLWDIVNDLQASDKSIAVEFQRANLPVDIVGDLRALITDIKTPLAVRSSSMLEDAIYEPLARVYSTKMIPNNQPDTDTRFRKLTEAIKFIYASTFFDTAKDYRQAIGKSNSDEKMAVIIQEVVGEKFGNYYYPHIAGVARSFDFYPMARAKPEDGVVNLALGLGKTIVDGGLVWSFSPSFPNVSPPLASIRDLLKNSQTKFWAVNLDKPPEYDPINEAEYLSQLDISDAEYDGTLKFIVSTYQAENDRLVIRIGPKGARLINFAPILRAELIKLNDLLKKIMQLCEESFECNIEIEFAICLDEKGENSRFGFLQIRPMVVSEDVVEISDDEMSNVNSLLVSEKVLGNGINKEIDNIIYVLPDSFNAANIQKIAMEIGEINNRLIAAGKTYLLIGFGRWGSSDPWLGIPVQWNQISGAKAIVEATLPNMNVEFSQGSHFFHNLSSFQVFYFLLYHDGKFKINWDWLADQREIAQTENIRHVELSSPLIIKTDGRLGRGVIRYEQK